jgi:hypothetical protein
MVEVRITRWCQCDSMSWATAVTVRQEFTLAAVLWQHLELVLTELGLLHTIEQLRKVAVAKVAKFMLRRDEVIATIEVAAMFECDCLSAGARVYAG